MSDAAFLWGSSSTPQGTSIGLSEATTPDFGFHQPYDARNLPASTPDPAPAPAPATPAEDPKKTSPCKTCAAHTGTKCAPNDPNRDAPDPDAKNEELRPYTGAWPPDPLSPSQRLAVDGSNAMEKAMAPWNTFNDLFGGAAGKSLKYEEP